MTCAANKQPGERQVIFSDGWTTSKQREQTHDGSSSLTDVCEAVPSGRPVFLIAMGPYAMGI